MNFSMAGAISLEIGVLTDVCLRMIVQEDTKHGLKIDKAVYKTILFYSAAVGSWICLFLSHWNWYGQLVCGILAAYLLVAAIQDHQSCEVYDFLHILAVPAGGVFVLMSPTKEKIISLVIFFVIQFGLFMRMYGAGDGLVFLVCAIYESRFGHGLATYLLHMAAVFALLGIVQGLKHNINKRGNLKKPVPLVPYIAGTVWFFL